MNEYNFFADLLNKYSQLTPWVQALVGLGACGVILGLAYFVKEAIAVLVSPFGRQNKPKDADDKKKWKDKYYREDGCA